MVMQHLRTRFFVALLLCSFSCFSQKDTVFARLQVPTGILEEKQFVFGLRFKNYHEGIIQVAVQPIFADKEADFGDVKFTLQKLGTGGCYDTMVIDSGPIGINLNNPVKNMYYGDSLSYSFDIRNIYYMRKGQYRIKTYLVYSKNKKPLMSSSDWIYFEVKTDRFPKRKSL